MNQARLIADIGGTNTRLALFDGSVHSVHHFENADFDGLSAVLRDYLGELEGGAPSQACFAVASALAKDTVAMTNNHWVFSRSAIAAAFGFNQCGWINDFAANAWSLPHLGSADLVPLRGAMNAGGDLAVMGPGTGLGAGVLVQGSAPCVRPSEAGFMSLSAVTAEEVAVFDYLRREHPVIYAELLLCGPGLPRLYRALAEVRGIEVESLDAAAITGAALADANSLSGDCLQMFCALLGSVAGDFMLANGCYGDLYLAGGITPKILPALQSSDFLERLAAKANMQPILSGANVAAIVHPNPGLLGAAHAPLA